MSGHRAQRYVKDMGVRHRPAEDINSRHGGRPGERSELDDCGGGGGEGSITHTSVYWGGTSNSFPDTEKRETACSLHNCDNRDALWMYHNVLVLVESLL